MVEEYKRKGYKVEGPLVPDTAFLNTERYEVFLCMYHDQGLIPFKMLAFREGVNLTLGLPFPRTSPDHGTAYDIAWKGVADPTPSRKALELLEKLVENLKG
ncbi:MAG: 4-hydroxythreonine-4-phosphate dehydrogenase PdxA [Aquificota bacterium]|nr:4-hydroxythreonine-4-phosphate dehydrogenase PdxA [Aquificota bacterium]